MGFARRGAVFELTSGPFDEGVVVTSDLWNDTKAEVGVIPIVDRTEPLAVAPPWYVPVSNGRLAVVGRVLSIPPSTLGADRGSLTADDLRVVEEAWIDGLSLVSLLEDPPQPPAPVHGALYPRWANVYWANYRIQGQRKFYGIISVDAWNARAPSVTLLRMTSTRRGPEFPEIAGGTYACAGNLTSFPIHGIDLNDPPPIRSIGVPQMKKIAAAIAVTHELGPALGLTDAELSALL